MTKLDKTLAQPGPLKNPVFRAIWIASIVSNIGTWVHEVGTAWLMTSLTPSMLMVALVQSALTAPMFLLALPAGALADIMDRRRLLLLAQSWMLFSAAVMAWMAWQEMMTPPLLLLGTFALGVGFALNAPAFQAIIPDIVGPQQIRSAATLSGAGINVARAIGPALGGVIVAAAGPAAAFAFNSLTFIVVLWVLARWRPSPRENRLPPESLVPAMLTGIRFVWHSSSYVNVLVRGFGFVLFASAFWALLPNVARVQLGASATEYGLMMGAVGVGAVAVAVMLAYFHGRISAHQLVGVASVIFGIAFVLLTYISSIWLAYPLLFVVGVAWVSALSSLNGAAQTNAPHWVKARALSVYLLFFFGGMSAGAACWGIIANQFGLGTTLIVAGSGLILSTILLNRFTLTNVAAENLTPAGHWPSPDIETKLEKNGGPVMVTVSYQIPTENQPQFLELMRELRRSRLRTGAYQWHLTQDLANPMQWLEVFFVSSWDEHLRQHDRVNLEDAKLQAQILEISIDPQTKVSHFRARSR
jgi:MFS family permease